MISQFSPIIAYLALFLALAGLFLGILAFVKARSLDKKMAVFFSGAEAKDLESIILGHSEEIKALDKEIQELFEISNRINGLAFRGIHKVGVIRFNPFKDIGGDQSFAIALLNGQDTGLVVSSLHTREGTRVYAKPIAKGSSAKYTLTEEEKQAIMQAVSAKNHPPKKSVHS